MICREQLLQMKKGAFVINTSRGGIINEDDLHKAMEGGASWGSSY